MDFKVFGRKIPWLLLFALVAGPLRADLRLRLLSPSYGVSQIRFDADTGSQYDLRQTSVAADLLGLEGRHDKFPWLSLGTAVFLRYDSAELSSVKSVSSGTGGSITIKSASFHMSTLAPCLMLTVYPFPNAEPLEPFVEARCELYEFSESSLESPGIDRYRPSLSIGLRSEPNETGYFWGARLTAGRRGYSGSFDGLGIPDPYVFGLQVDWIGLLL